MSEFLQQLSDLKKHLPQVKPWIVIAVVAAVALLAYYSYQGKTYWDATQRAEMLDGQIKQVSTILAKSPPESGGLAEELDIKERNLAELRRLFTYESTDALMGILSAAANDSGVNLASMSVGNPVPDRQGDISFQKQPFSLTLQGNAIDISRFLATLNQRVPVTEVSDIRLTTAANVETVARVQLVFYLSPQVVSDEDGAD